MYVCMYVCISTVEGSSWVPLVPLLYYSLGSHLINIDKAYLSLNNLTTEGTWRGGGSIEGCSRGTHD